MPVMVLMMAFMRVLEKKGILKNVAVLVSPVFIIFGLPGIGVFGILQIMFVSFAAPVTTLKLMNDNPQLSKARIAATLAAILTMCQANATFPLAAVGLDIPSLLLTSTIGALVAAFLTFKVFARKYHDKDENKDAWFNTNDNGKKEKKPFMKIIMEGAEEGFNLVLKSLPMLLLAIILVNVLKTVGAIGFLQKLLSPVLNKVGIEGSAVLTVLTKYIAGGTAMMGVTLDLVKDGSLSVLALNKIAGFIVNPLDPVGVAFLASAGERVSSVVMPAIKGAIIGIIVGGVIHLLMF
jgi:spore maturation protein SpmB